MSEPPTAQASLVSAVWKYRRAAYLSSDIAKCVEKFLSENPPSLRKDYADEGIETLVLVVPSPPFELSIAIGEYFHNLRGSLDHLTSAIVSKSTGKIDRRIGFPFHETRSQLLNTRTKDALYKAAPDVWDLIVDEFKPYRAHGPDGPSPPIGEEGLLWAIKELNNQDKHRLIIPSLATASTSMDLWPGSLGNVFQITGSGEFVVGRGSYMPPQKVYYSDVVIDEPDITGAVKLVPFLEACTNLVARVGQSLKAHLFGENAPQVSYPAGERGGEGLL
ncbi:MAG: hypothetical protein KA098_01570 [Phenylobacterium sp.]|nr:hypothetical protein [Phenylobacterium sp.]